MSLYRSFVYGIRVKFSVKYILPMAAKYRAYHRLSISELVPIHSKFQSKLLYIISKERKSSTNVDIVTNGRVKRQHLLSGSCARMVSVIICCFIFPGTCQPMRFLCSHQTANLFDRGTLFIRISVEIVCISSICLCEGIDCALRRPFINSIENFADHKIDGWIKAHRMLLWSKTEYGLASVCMSVEADDVSVNCIWIKAEQWANIWMTMTETSWEMKVFASSRTSHRHKVSWYWWIIARQGSSCARHEIRYRNLLTHENLFSCVRLHHCWRC